MSFENIYIKQKHIAKISIKAKLLSQVFGFDYVDIFFLLWAFATQLLVFTEQDPISRNRIEKCRAMSSLINRNRKKHYLG